MGGVLLAGGIRNIKAVIQRAFAQHGRTEVSEPESQHQPEAGSDCWATQNVRSTKMVWRQSCLSSPTAVNSVLLLLHMQSQISPVALLHCLLNLSGSFLHQNWVSSLRKTAQIGMLSLCCEQAQVFLYTCFNLCQQKGTHTSKSYNQSFYKLQLFLGQACKSSHYPQDMYNVEVIQWKTTYFPHRQIDLMWSQLWGTRAIPFQSFALF